jgi:hypothetical protein
VISSRIRRQKSRDASRDFLSIGTTSIGQSFFRSLSQPVKVIFHFLIGVITGEKNTVCRRPRRPRFRFVACLLVALVRPKVGVETYGRTRRVLTG